MTTSKKRHRDQPKSKSIEAKSDFKTRFQQKDEARELQDVLLFYFTYKIKRIKIGIEAIGKMNSTWKERGIPLRDDISSIHHKLDMKDVYHPKKEEHQVGARGQQQTLGERRAEKEERKRKKGEKDSLFRKP
ncbi:hypothetical protein H5410_004456 [Solanum commersonii]|uniref:Uncharacterized protein n=1 Tax=Solanum commersonii TaxID=4109 RepID=A0A9J6B808_SOLCO|nr:hypothetical protein H5410_004456 [Solanum commersonii]